jgi:DNA mismatch endonuclease (patch repair protein)
VFGPAKVAVFVDGCFWHGCPQHGQRTTNANPTYWTDKVARNSRRDAETDEALTEAGWLPIRVWEHDDPKNVAELVEAQVRSRRGDTEQSGL